MNSFLLVPAKLRKEFMVLYKAFSWMAVCEMISSQAFTLVEQFACIPTLLEEQLF